MIMINCHGLPFLSCRFNNCSNRPWWAGKYKGNVGNHQHCWLYPSYCGSYLVIEQPDMKIHLNHDKPAAKQQPPAIYHQPAITSHVLDHGLPWLNTEPPAVRVVGAWRLPDLKEGARLTLVMPLPEVVVKPGELAALASAMMVSQQPWWW